MVYGTTSFREEKGIITTYPTYIEKILRWYEQFYGNTFENAYEMDRF